MLAVHQVAKEAIERARAGGGPTLIEAKTYRTVGHHEGDPVAGTYRTQEEVDRWAKRDPLVLFRERLVEEYAIATGADLAEIEARIEAIVEDSLDFARKSPEPDPATVRDHVYATPLNPPEALAPPATAPTVTTSWLDAVRDGIAEEMRRDPHIMYFGEGTGERGGTFAHTKGLWQEFGPKRMVDTPISEQGFTGAAIGASATGARTIADLMFADFLFEAAGQIVLQAAKLRYMSNGQMNAPVVIRAGAGAVRSAGPHHSGMYHPMWAHVPGLIVCLPSTPADAKGLMKSALRAADPVIMLETKALFATKGEVPTGEHFVPFGVARIARAGSDLTIAAAGQLVHRALEAAETLAARGHRLRGHRPPHHHAARRRDGGAKRRPRPTGCSIVDEGWAMCGVGAELGQAMNELAFDELDAPVARLHTEPMSHPLAPSLERAMLVDADKIAEAARGCVDGRPPVPWHWRSASGGNAAVTAAPPSRRQRRRRRQRQPRPLPSPSRRSTASRSPCPSATSPSAKARSCAGQRRKAKASRPASSSPRSRPTRRWSRSKRPSPASSPASRSPRARW